MDKLDCRIRIGFGSETDRCTREDIICICRALLAAINKINEIIEQLNNTESNSR